MIDWKVFLSTFAALFVAELGDKTQLAVITLTSKHDGALSVFLGASAALVCVTLLGVLGGQALLSVLPAEASPDLQPRVSWLIGRAVAMAYGLDARDPNSRREAGPLWRLRALGVGTV